MNLKERKYQENDLTHYFGAFLNRKLKGTKTSVNYDISDKSYTLSNSGAICKTKIIQENNKNYSVIKLRNLQNKEKSELLNKINQEIEEFDFIDKTEIFNGEEGLVKIGLKYVPLGNEGHLSGNLHCALFKSINVVINYLKSVNSK